jgi:octaprenyl-diphosphate synthase
VVLAFRRGDADERAFWKRTMEDQEFEDGDLDHAMELIDRHNALTDSIERARHYGAMARDALGIFPDSPYKKALIDIVDFCISRAH